MRSQLPWSAHVIRGDGSGSDNQIGDLPAHFLALLQLLLDGWPYAFRSSWILDAPIDVKCLLRDGALSSSGDAGPPGCHLSLPATSQIGGSDTTIAVSTWLCRELWRPCMTLPMDMEKWTNGIVKQGLRV